MATCPAPAQDFDSGESASMPKVWQYNGVAPFMSIVFWCINTFESVEVWDYSSDTIWFMREQDYVLFLLKWR